MGFFSNLFGSTIKRAKRAEAQGDYRTAASLYVEAERPKLAAQALMTLGARSTGLDERFAAYQDALRWMPEDDPERIEAHAQIGVTLLELAKQAGAQSGEERRRALEAAEHLEKGERFIEAADAWEIIGRKEDISRCLQQAGAIERLEAFLDEGQKEDERARALRLYVHEYEMAMAVGARDEAYRALQKAYAEDPGDVTVRDLIDRFEAKRLSPRRVVLSVNGDRIGFIGGFPATIGRGDAEIVLRGTSLSRRHCQIERDAGGFALSDLGSRNGTLVHGMPMAERFALHGPTQVGFGDDVSAELRPLEDGSGVVLSVVKGLDRGLTTYVTDARVMLGSTPLCLDFVDGQARLHPPSEGFSLFEQPCKAPVLLLCGDKITAGQTQIEVVE